MDEQLEQYWMPVDLYVGEIIELARFPPTTVLHSAWSLPRHMVHDFDTYLPQQQAPLLLTMSA